ncbi:MAG: hypothetical protein ACPGOV_00255 [Magnetovibrionaceae bacterium]
MGWFDFGSTETKSDQTTSAPLEINWARNPRGRFFRLVHLDPEEQGLSKAHGVYVIWHGGVKPKWVHLGYTSDLASVMFAAGENEDIMQYEINGRLFVSWSPVKPSYQPGVAAYLERTLKPLVANPANKKKGVKEVAVKPPSRQTPL